ncbi:hypothetical protein [Caballeronia sp. EK]|uniref:hypothetical protein n=1 Tax=Caballeronia sp. EK TaxID=2767469 RepID=UPI001CA40C2B|nr:hypothetical protein [Caballeronia sp. EK]
MADRVKQEANSHAWNLRDAPAGPTLYEQAQTSHSGSRRGDGRHVIALWLGHESIETTQTYLHAHLALKGAALSKLKPYENRKSNRFRPGDRLISFLESL